MKKLTAILIAASLAVTLLASCGARLDTSEVQAAPSAGYDSSYYGETGMGGGTSGYAPTPEPALPPVADYAPDIAYDEDYYAYEKEYSMNVTSTSPSDPAGIAPPVLPVEPQAGDGLNEKIIYSAYAEIETVDFDSSIDTVYTLMDTHGAFIENSNVSGKSHKQEFYDYPSYRTARFTLRVPQQELLRISDSLESLGNVISLQNSAQNITSQFVDTESRLKTSRVEETRLLEMLAKADTVADMIVIEARLSEVRYQIESMTTSLKNWQNQIDYSTLTLNIYEVEKLSEIVPVQRSYWTQIADGFKSSLTGIGHFFMNLFKWLVVAMPVIVLVAVILLVLIIIGKKASKRLLRRDFGSKHDEDRPE